MKKAFMTGFLGIAFAFAMVACNGNATTEDTTATTPEMEQCEEPCMHHCQMTCPDSVCLAANCENCTCPEDSPCKQKPECKGEGQCCKEKAAAEGCCKKETAEGCKNHEGCKKECENHK